MAKRTKLILNPSFKLSDVYGLHRNLIFGGVIVSLCGALTLIGGAFTYKTATADLALLDNAKNVGQLASSIYSKDGYISDVDLPVLIDGAKALRDHYPNVDSIDKSSGVEDPFKLFGSAWQTFSVLLAESERSSLAVNQLRAAITENRKLLNEISKGVDIAKSLGLTPAIGYSYSDAYYQLQAMSESRIGSGSAAKIDYDLQVLSYIAKQAATNGQADTRTLFNNVELLRNKVQPFAVSAKASALTQTQLSKIADASTYFIAAINPAYDQKAHAAKVSLLCIIGGIVLVVVSFCVGAYVVARKFMP